MKDFSDYLKKVRKASKLTQSAVCQDICSIREYQRIESNSIEPSTYFLRRISQRLGYDFEAYYFLLKTNGEEAELYNHRKELNDLLDSRQYQKLHERIAYLSSEPMYQLFDNRKMLLHYDSIYYSKYEQNYEKSNELCMMIIHDDDPYATDDNFCSKLFSKYAIYSAHVIALNCSAQHNEQMMIRIYNELIDRIDQLDRDDISFYQSNNFRRNLHQTLLYNLSINYQRADDYAEAERCVDTAIKYASDYAAMYLLAELCGQKAELLCSKKKFDEAKKYLSLSSGLFMIRGQEDKGDGLQTKFEDIYPELK